MRLPIVMLALSLPLAVGACGDDGPLGLEDVSFAPALGVDLSQMTRLSTGVYIQTVLPGFGSYMVTLSDDVEVSYTLWLPDGTEIDQGELTRPLSSLIPGFQDGVVGMTTGQIRLIVIPPGRGYGANPPAGSGIPVNSVLVFRVELLSVPSGP